jgi:hypothetical protein
MADPAIKVHTNRTEITGLTSDALNRTVDLTPFLTHDDPKIVVILAECQNTSGALYTYGVTRTSGTFILGQISGNGGYTPSTDYFSQVTPIALDANQIRYNLPAASGIKLFIITEFGGDSVIPFTGRRTYSHSSAAWVTRTVFLEDAAHDGDIEMVIGLADSVSTGNGKFRAIGSSDAAILGSPDNSQHMLTAKVDDNNQFQSYTNNAGLKTFIAGAAMYGEGYILRGEYENHIVEATQNRVDIPFSELPAPQTGVISASQDVNDVETQAIVQMRSQGTVVANSVNAKSYQSTDPARVHQTGESQARGVNLNTNKQFEYYSSTYRYNPTQNWINFVVQAVQYSVNHVDTTVDIRGGVEDIQGGIVDIQ